MCSKQSFVTNEYIRDTVVKSENRFQLKGSLINHENV